MDASQVALKLVLDDLGVGADISTKSRRKTVQKAVYLVQAAGVDLGYRYNWYVMGPYSPALTRDYYALQQGIEASLDVTDDYELQAPVATVVADVMPILEPPAGVDLEQADWVELVASVHFLLTKQRRSEDDARLVINSQKPHVAPYFELALAELKSKGLLN